MSSGIQCLIQNVGLSLSSVLNAASCVSDARDDRGRGWTVTWFVATLFSQWRLSSTHASLQPCLKYQSTRCEGSLFTVIIQSEASYYYLKHSNIPKHYKQIHVRHENDHLCAMKYLPSLSWSMHACGQVGILTVKPSLSKMLKVFNKIIKEREATSVLFSPGLEYGICIYLFIYFDWIFWTSRLLFVYFL